MDEDVDIAVGGMLAVHHEVRYVVQDLGPSAKDSMVERYAESENLVLVTGDRPMANRVRQSLRHGRRRMGCLFLHSLYETEQRRTTELLDVIVTEHARSSDRFWMEIADDYYRVMR
jgi:predicted nuclease of predicted toxin-antitoxin system